MRVTRMVRCAGRARGPDRARRLAWLLMLPLLAMLTGACATVRARPESPPPTGPGTPPLVVSDPRAEPDSPAEIPPPADRPASKRPAPTRPTDREPEQTATPEPAPLPLLLAPEAGVDPRDVAALLTTVATLLDRIERPRLSLADRFQYDTARRFIDQATIASKAGNLLFARYLGKKAEALARALSS